MTAIATDQDNNLARIPFAARFEGSVPESTVVTLNTLCKPCDDFVQSSALLRRLGRGKDIRIGVEETGTVGTPRDLRRGYHSGECHLCALLWVRAGGHLLDPGTDGTGGVGSADEPVEVRLTARDPEKEYEIMVGKETDRAKKLWYKIASSPGISENGYIDLSINLVRKDKVYADLHVHHSSNPKLNKETLNFTSSPISSLHPSTYSKIKAWQQNCSTSHARCRQFPHLVSPTRRLPSRLLDLSNDRVRLEPSVSSILSENPNLEYTTLSHMWGLNPSSCPQLQLSTLAAFTLDIPLSSLPDKYVYAIHITRALGYRYIWIDSLCIIQDSPEDWTREALLMASVYGGTAVNISYTFPPDSDTPQNHLRDPRVHLPCLTSPPSSSKWNEKTLVINYRPGYHRPAWSPTVYKTLWPLLSRGWVFQERLLCPRTVYIGQDRQLWECCDAIIDEFYGPLTTVPGSKSHFHRIITGIAASFHSEATAPQTTAADSSPPEAEKKKNKNLFLDFDEDRTNADAQWGPLVRDYRAAELTKEFDRGIAFAGIARAIQAAAGVTYLAGLWRELFAFDMLWSVGLALVGDNAAAEQAKVDKRKREMKKAPSWSWFAIVPMATAIGGDVLDWPFRTTMQTYRRHGVFEASVLGYRHPKAGAGAGGGSDVLLHDFEGMSVTLRAKRIPCGFEWWDEFGMLYVVPFGETELIMGRHANMWRGEAVRPRVLKYAHDESSVKKGDVLPEGAHMVLTVEQAWHVDAADVAKRTYDFVRGEDVPSTWKTSYQYAGIVVVPAGGGAEGWRRIGAFMLFDDFTGHEVRGPFDGVSEEELVLV
ncbi:heterokaryon incompatibility protein-domain-containing protein [Echria macrotheca]|uniref:Heterokaryon incompatibility protein-domain-containing protein n=1 Tax=Echria macrotheca TaxID=438768 RepID=A0AAJ0B3K8_9PEZI|nr:heterokaryon incompatibility protein-domain-containing protein [Echria macrotheca]